MMQWYFQRYVAHPSGGGEILLCSTAEAAMKTHKDTDNFLSR
jgi:hypothetical protein